jgi:taurine dioxygenase
MHELKVRRMGYALGARVTGVDLKRPLDDATVAQIRHLWLEHCALCFPNQDLSKEEFLAFARRFGDLISFSPQDAVHPDPVLNNITLLTNKSVDGKPYTGLKSGASWHTDQSFCTEPPVGTFLCCKETPPVGGDTMFANLYMAYDALSPAMKSMVESLSAVHVGPRYYRTGRTEIPTAQPLVRVHPETKRKALYAAGDRARIVQGMTEEESRPLLDFLLGHVVSYEFTYRHRWTVNDVVMWDNRCLMHKALCDYDLQNDARHLFRCSLKGSPSGEPYYGELPADPGISGKQHVAIGAGAS